MSYHLEGNGKFLALARVVDLVCKQFHFLRPPMFPEIDLMLRKKLVGVEPSHVL